MILRPEEILKLEKDLGTTRHSLPRMSYTSPDGIARYMGFLPGHVVLNIDDQQYRIITK
jgi:DNA-directed RNA polymerase subunit H (RpoH/RPB5)